MNVLSDKHELREQLADWRRVNEHIAIVPTMGSLHAGHISLIDEARKHAERVVVSVFVNPTQFGADEDFDNYPRTFDKDTRRLRQVAADLMFTPDVETMYPFGIDKATRVSVPGLTENFCGKFRPGHFDGVTTVVARLFALTQPDVAIFGQKDYQQQLVIRRMVEDLNLPISVITAPTVREDDGLAMSSRNAYLSDAERQQAPALFRTLNDTAEALQGGAKDFSELETDASQALSSAGLEPEYFAVRRAADLDAPRPASHELVVLAAARLGKARLIDNILVSV